MDVISFRGPTKHHVTKLAVAAEIVAVAKSSQRSSSMAQRKTNGTLAGARLEASSCGCAASLGKAEDATYWAHFKELSTFSHMLTG